MARSRNEGGHLLPLDDMELIHYSDRGTQYCPVDHQAVLHKRGILISMSGRGNCFENSLDLHRKNGLRTLSDPPRRVRSHQEGADLADRFAIPPAG